MSSLSCVIAGAGPAGLVAALSLGKAGIKVTVLERASKEKVSSDVGSGFRVGLTASEIFERLGLGEQLNQAYQDADFMRYYSMNGNLMRSRQLKNSTRYKDKKLRRVLLRSYLQRVLLEEIASLECVNIIYDAKVMRFTDEKDKPVKIFCLVKGEEKNYEGDVLLACDGIHSSVRSYMYSDEADYLHFCNCVTWWGAMDVGPESTLFQYLQEAKFSINQTSLLYGIGTSRQPGHLEASVSASANVPGGYGITWSLTRKSKESYFFHSDDVHLGKRGGISGEESKLHAYAAAGDKFKLLRKIIEATPDAKIVECGLFDRERLDLPYVNGRVALVGDAAHPQTQSLNQGFNTAVVDAYCLAQLLQQNSPMDAETVQNTLKQYGNEKRHKQMNYLITKARKKSLGSVSNTWIKSLHRKYYYKYKSAGALDRAFANWDFSNRKILNTTDKTTQKHRNKKKFSI
mmetsp:Transcript_5056/g.6144  ORF Transcript_5056/g.6144 Transcript_5056/m.6144 type:complete len:459 (-) Transcript_5056:493-1869(-)